MFRVALTGGIASGKSTVAAEFRRLGVPVIDTDQLARQVVEPGQAGHASLLDEFGPDVFDDAGHLDRNRLREMIFANEKTRERLNALLHPLIREQLASEIERLRSPYAIIEIPLLLETNSEAQFDRILVVDIDEATQLERLMRRDTADPEDARRIMAAQAGREERLAAADDLIDNSDDRAALRSRVEALHQQYLGMAERFATPPQRPSE